MKFHSLHLGSQIARNKDRLEIAMTLAAVAAIVAFLIAGSHLVAALLAS